MKKYILLTLLVLPNILYIHNSYASSHILLLGISDALFDTEKPIGLGIDYEFIFLNNNTYYYGIGCSFDYMVIPIFDIRMPYTYNQKNINIGPTLLHPISKNYEILLSTKIGIADCYLRTVINNQTHDSYYYKLNIEGSIGIINKIFCTYMTFGNNYLNLKFGIKLGPPNKAL